MNLLRRLCEGAGSGNNSGGIIIFRGGIILIGVELL